MGMGNAVSQSERAVRPLTRRGKADAGSAGRGRVGREGEENLAVRPQKGLRGKDRGKSVGSSSRSMNNQPMSTPPTFRGGRAPGRRETRAGATAIVALLLTACGSTHKATTSDSTTTTTLNAEAQAVLTGWRAAQQAFTAAEENAQGAYSPALAATMVDPELTGVRRELLGDEHAGDISMGQVDLGHPTVVVSGARTATVTSCVYSSLELVVAATGKPVPPPTPPEHDLVTSSMVETSTESGGVWKESTSQVLEGKCVGA